MRNTPPASPSRPVDASASDRYDAGTQRLGVLMEKYTQPLPESNGEQGDPPCGAWQSQRASTPLPTSQANDPSLAVPSLAEASSELSKWLAGYFTDPMCGLKGVVMVSLFEALDEVCTGDEPWDEEGEAPDLFIVRGVMSGGLMDGLRWETGEAWEENVEEDLASLDEELRASYPAVYGIDDTNNADGLKDMCGFPSVSVGPGANGPGGREEETCEQVGDGQGEGCQLERGTQILEVVEDVPGWVADEGDGNGGDSNMDVLPSPPVGEATEAAVGDLLRLGGVFATEGSVCDRDLGDTADLVARRLRIGGGSGQGDKNMQKGEEEEGGKEEDSEIVPNSQEDDEGPPLPAQQRLQEAHDDDGFAMPSAKPPRGDPTNNENTYKCGTPSNPNDFNPESDPYLLSGLHATADCLAMVQPTAREELPTEPWMSIPNLEAGGANPIVCGAAGVARNKQKRTAQGGRGVRVAAKKARTTPGPRQENVDIDETEAQEDSMSEYSDTACPDDLRDGVDEDEEDEDGDVQIRNRPHRMIATCPPESQASAKASQKVGAKAKPNAKSNRKSGPVAAQRKANDQDEAEHEGTRCNPRRSARLLPTPNENTEDVPIGEYVEAHKKVGCSKCRNRGCSKCRGHTLKEMAQKKGLFHGIAFMISRDGNKVDTKAQAELVKTIQGMGGQVLASLGDLLRLSSGMAKPKANGKGAILVTSNANSRTLKCIAARAIGLPMISPTWITNCAAKSRLGGLTARAAHVIVGKGSLRPSGPLLDRLNVYLVIERNIENAQDISALVKLLGGVPSPVAFNAKTDLVLYDDSRGSAQLKKEIDRVKREARKLRKPAHPLSWLTDAIAKGETDRVVEELEEALGPITANTPLPAKKSDKPKAREGARSTRGARANGSDPDRPVVLETEGDRQSEDKLEAFIQQQQVASEERRQKEQRLKVRSGRANRQPGHQPAMHRALEESAPNTFKETDDPFCQPVAHPFQGISSMVDIECTWKPIDDSLTGGTPPEGMRPTSIRKYFSCMLSSNRETIRVGDFVEMVPGPGANQPLVAQVLALWKQVGRPKESCLYGRFLRYYRFDETSLNHLGLKSADNRNRVYKTSHVEENVPLAAILSQCRVEVLSGVDAPTEFQTQRMSDEGCSLLCSATYDFETGTLAPIE